MERKAKVFYTNRSQAVRLPKDFQVDADEVYIRKEGQAIILTPRPRSWNDYLAQGAAAPEDYLSGVDDLPVQVRNFQ